MKPAPFALLLLLLALAACDRQPTEADAVAAGFEPPTALPRADFATLLDRRFRQMDVNIDGAIDKAEAGARAQALETFDTDHDGRVSRAEFSGGRLARFDQVDADHDGIVTNKEQDAARASRAPDHG